MHFVEQKHEFNKNETESKMENSTNSFRVLERHTLYFSSYRNRKLKVKLWWVLTRERKGRAFFVPFILSKGNFIFVLSQCIVNWIHFQNIHTFTYQKTLFHTLLVLVFKIVLFSNVSRSLMKNQVSIINPYVVTFV